MNYNAYGVKDGKAFQAVTAPFFDNIVFSVLVASYQITVSEGKDERSRKYEHIATCTKNLRQVCEKAGVRVSDVKPVALRRVDTNVTKELKGKLLFPKTSNVDTAEYFWQDIKVACAEADSSKVLSFVKQGVVHEERNLFLKDVDITLDHAGSFDKTEVVEAMLATGDFRMEGCAEALQPSWTTTSMKRSSEKV